VADDPLASAHHLERFDRRFGCRLVVHLDASHRAPGVPTLRLEDDDDAARTAVAAAVEQAGGMGIGREDTAVVTRDLASAAVGRSWSLVVVPDATEGRWPAPRPVDRWFDRELFHGPDLPSDDERDERWLALERRRFGVATSRADRFLVVVACLPASRFVGDLIR
jgi:superfamily I DNA/RNA helicase